MTKHLHCVDGLRGLGALAVLFWHYQSFYVPSGTPLSQEQLVGQPLYEYFWPLYHFGWAGVQVFWGISGAVFAATYVGRPQIGAVDFATKRFARLYPLHLLTLIIVALLQIASMQLVGRPQIYGNNDAYHFLLHIFLASDWGLEAGNSFNAPIWSVSVEVLIYAVFFLAIPALGSGRLWPSAGLAALMYLVSYATHSPIAACGVHFFAGSFTLLLFRRSFAAGCVVVVAAGISLWIFLPLAGSLPATVSLAVLLVGAAIAIDYQFAPNHHIIARMGDFSYASYLIHMPIIMAVLILLDFAGIERAVADSLVFFIAFFATVIVGSLVVHRVFELPAKRAILRSTKEMLSQHQTAGGDSRP